MFRQRRTPAHATTMATINRACGANAFFCKYFAGYLCSTRRVRLSQFKIARGNVAARTAKAVAETLEGKTMIRRNPWAALTLCIAVSGASCSSDEEPQVAVPQTD